ncbi:MAG TPA: exosome complex RNA-binding protein Csl4 [Candidatus Krumholzibacteriaceae bacterium]|nr:exosome complex RNA-binding protein Csl4 [Candidatus Krumholzibacteriaceae bacterium]
MVKKTKIDGKEVFPGERLAVIEEYNEGEGTYQSDGEVRSAEIGVTRHDGATRSVAVEKKTPKIIVPEEGMVAVAEVGSVARRDARVDIFMLDGRHIHPTYSGVIHISDISRDYTKNIDMALRNGDTVKGRIVNVKNRLNQMSLADPEYGVIYAYCSRCGGLLDLDRGKLTCPDCGRVERRKTARSYGKEALV